MKNILRKILFKITLGRGARLFRESRLAHQYCRGKGIEIGGSAHNPFGLNTLNIDFFNSSETCFKKEEKRLCGRTLPVDIVAAGDCLPLADECQNFVVSSHVIEHFSNPIQALVEWDRVIKPNGILFMIVPHKDRTFDSKRECTTLAHLIRDFHDDDAARGEEAPPQGHYHVWVTEDFVELINYMITELRMAWKLVEIQDRDDKVGNGFTIVIKKLASRSRSIPAEA